jgi:acyl-CoA reductase-like NAD-dependent aldehyde dehydrogenase
LIAKIKKDTVIGDPTDLKVNLGPLALERQVTLLKTQV